MQQVSRTRTLRCKYEEIDVDEPVYDIWVFLKTVYIRNEQNVTVPHRLF